jgi:hypothetical protein
MTTQSQHPCTKFQNGEVTDFYTAMEVLVEQQQFERQQLIRIAHEYGGVSSQQREDAMNAVEVVKGQVEIAKTIYQEVVENALKRAGDAMRKHNDPGLNAIADAVERGDYSGLSL